MPTAANGGVPAPAGLARRPGRVIVASRERRDRLTPLRTLDAEVHAVADLDEALGRTTTCSAR